MQRSPTTAGDYTPRRPSGQHPFVKLLYSQDGTWLSAGCESGKPRGGQLDRLRSAIASDGAQAERRRGDERRPRAAARIEHACIGFTGRAQDPLEQRERLLGGPADALACRRGERGELPDVVQALAALQVVATPMVPLVTPS